MLKFKEVEVEDLIKGLGNVLQYRLVVEYLACTSKTKKIERNRKKKRKGGKEGERMVGREEKAKRRKNYSKFKSILDQIVADKLLAISGCDGHFHLKLFLSS